MNIQRFPLGALWTNGYLLWDEEGHAFFVDPGGDPGDVIAFLQEKSLKLERILLTHGHADHMCGAEALREKTGAPLGVHREDGEMILHPEHNLSQFMGAPCEARPAEQLFEDDSSFAVGALEITVLHTPGHTPGSCLFHVRSGEEEVLLSGDTLFAQSVGRTDLPGGSSELLEHSLLRFQGFPGALRVLPGHGPETTIEEEARNNPFWPR